MAVARLKPGVTIQQAQTEMDVIARRLEQAYPATNKGIGKKVVGLHENLFSWAGEALYPLFGAVGFVLLIACVNVANLMKSRTETRRKEFAVRASLGAGRGRLMQQLFVESGLLAFLGAAVGILLAILGIQIFRSLAGDFPNVDDVRIDGRVLLFTLGMKWARLLMAIATSVVAGAVTAWISRSSRWAAPLIVGSVVLAIFVPAHIAIWSKFPAWYHLTFLLTIIPAVLVGALLPTPRRARTSW